VAILAKDLPQRCTLCLLCQVPSRCYSVAMALCEPSIEECTAFLSVDDVLKGAGFRPGVDDKSTARCALMLALDVQADEHFRVIGSLTDLAYADVLKGVRVEGPDGPRPLSISENSKGDMFGKAARIAAGRDERLTDVRKRLADEAALARTAAVQATSSAVVPPVQKKVRLSTVADQANDLEVPELGPAEVAAAYARFEALTGGAASTGRGAHAGPAHRSQRAVGGLGPALLRLRSLGPLRPQHHQKDAVGGSPVGPAR
jgi:hypothetical protein